MFKKAMRNLAEKQMEKNRFSERCEAHQEMTWKLHKTPNYVDKLNYFDNQIENTMRSLNNKGKDCQF